MKVSEEVYSYGGLIGENLFSVTSRHLQGHKDCVVEDLLYDSGPGFLLAASCWQETTLSSRGTLSSYKPPSVLPHGLSQNGSMLYWVGNIVWLQTCLIPFFGILWIRILSQALPTLKGGNYLKVQAGGGNHDFPRVCVPQIEMCPFLSCQFMCMSLSSSCHWLFPSWGNPGSLKARRPASNAL